MIQSDVRNGSNQGLGKHIGAVQSAAHTCFQNHCIHFFFGKPGQGHAESPFKKRRLKLSGLQLRSVTFNKLHHPFLGRHFTVDAHPLPEIGQMRRRKQGHLPSLCLQCIGKSGTNRTFAIGTCHVDDMI